MHAVKGRRHMTQSLPSTFFEPAISLDIPVGCGRERVAAMIEALTGMSLLGPCYPRAGREERARSVAEARAVLSTNPHVNAGTRKPRRPTLANLLKQAAKADKRVTGAEVYPDRTVLQFGEPAPAESDNLWSLDEFRAKETKQ